MVVTMCRYTAWDLSVADEHRTPFVDQPAVALMCEIFSPRADWRGAFDLRLGRGRGGTSSPAAVGGVRDAVEA